jgi:UDP-N-acetylglucosamine 2-epimerase (non-hydrolysing)
MKILKRKLIFFVVGARPNFIKVAPLLRELKNSKEFEFKLIHTGQHYDKLMSNIFFHDLSINAPDYNLNIRGGSQNTQIAKIMLAFEEICSKDNPNYIFVFGDVNSTLAASITAKKMNIPLIHYEGGLRSFDRNMPEEINRLMCDSVTDYFFCTEDSAVDNLLNEGKTSDKIFLVGNLMIDSLFYQVKKSDFKVYKEDYAVLTMHRPSNVNDTNKLKKLISILNEIAKKIKIIFPVHPRTKESIGSFKLHENIEMINPLGYNDFSELWTKSKFVITDSGGIQEETTALKIPCLTIRDNTERPITVYQGSSTIVGSDKKKILLNVDKILNNKYKASKVPKFWDGKSAERILRIMKTIK